MESQLIQGDCLEIIPVKIPPKSIDLVFGSPPYEDCRTYGIGFNLKGQEWVDWMMEVYRMCLSRCKGLVAFVIQGRTRNYKWSCTPALLIADLHRAGFNLRNPPIYHRVGIPGSGRFDWLRSDYEWIVCASQPGRLPWSDNTICGNEPKFEPGGDCTNRKKNGERIRFALKIGMSEIQKQSLRHKTKADGMSGTLNSDNTITRKNGSIYKPPIRANPGNIIHCSGGHLGSRLAHENEAPFPEKLAEFFIRSFCPPGGIVLDPFSGSGTTCAMAKKWGRKYIGIDIRESQIELTQRRLNENS